MLRRFIYHVVEIMIKIDASTEPRSEVGGRRSLPADLLWLELANTFDRIIAQALFLIVPFIFTAQYSIPVFDATCLVCIIKKWPHH